MIQVERELSVTRIFHLHDPLHRLKNIVHIGRQLGGILRNQLDKVLGMGLAGRLPPPFVCG